MGGQEAVNSTGPSQAQCEACSIKPPVSSWSEDKFQIWGHIRCANAFLRKEECLVKCQEEEYRKPPCCPRPLTKILSEILRRTLNDWKAHCGLTLVFPPHGTAKQVCLSCCREVGSEARHPSQECTVDAQYMQRVKLGLKPPHLIP